MLRYFFSLVLIGCSLPASVGRSETPLHELPAPPAEWPGPDDLPVQSGLPNPLAKPGGGQITSAEEWAAARPRLLRILEEYGYGHVPPAPAGVAGSVVQTTQVLDGAARCEKVRVEFGQDGKLAFDMVLFRPTDAGDGPLPTIVTLSFGGSERAAPRYSAALSRGYLVATINYTQLGADRPDFRKSAFFPAYPDHDWNDMAAWSWGLSRGIDYLTTRPDVDAGKIVALGVSRVGHAVLHAGAFDDRIALVAPVGAGCAFRFCGAGRGGKQGIDEIVAQADYWFGPRLPEFVGQTERLPWDQHWLLALAAPRPIILCNALDDPYVQGNAIAQSYLGARPVFETLGVADRVAVNFRAGGHGMRGEDWQAILDFADWQLRGQPIERRFDKLPPADRLH